MATPPTITAVTLSTPSVTVGTPVQAFVAWTGDQGGSIAYQWFLGTARIKGERGAFYLPAAEVSALNCLVEVDNGAGTASARSAEISTATPGGEDPAVIGTAVIGSTFVVA